MKTTACKLQLGDTLAGIDSVIAGSDDQTESVQAVLATELQRDKCGAKALTSQLFQSIWSKWVNTSEATL